MCSSVPKLLLWRLLLQMRGVHIKLRMRLECKIVRRGEGAQDPPAGLLLRTACQGVCVWFLDR